MVSDQTEVELVCHLLGIPNVKLVALRLIGVKFSLRPNGGHVSSQELFLLLNVFDSWLIVYFCHL